MADLLTYSRDPAAFIDRYITRNELGQPFTLMAHQREILSAAFAFDADGRLPWDTIIYSAVKKSGKTTLNGAVTLWWAFTQEAPNDLKICANDQEQSVSRTFTTIEGLLKYNTELGASAKVLSAFIELSNGTTIEALANDYAGEAGANQGWSSWTELWAFTSEAARRMWEELTPVPTRRNSVRFIDTYAGFEGESDLLYSLYKLVVDRDEHSEGQGERLHPILPIFANREARIFAYWDHEPRMPWQTPAYYAAQRRQLRPSTYLRLHENRWTSGASAFITSELWDACVDTGARPVLIDRNLPIWIGVDAAQKHDTAAVVAVSWDRVRFRLVRHQIWKPTPTAPLDLEATIEAELREWSSRFSIQRVLCDPWQLARSISTLKAVGLPIEEFPQTTANTSAMGQTLWEVLTGNNITLYPDDELRAQALNTVAIEGPRGFRIAKEKAARKIDAIVALAMACRSAVDEPVSSVTVGKTTGHCYAGADEGAVSYGCRSRDGITCHVHGGQKLETCDKDPIFRMMRQRGETGIARVTR